MDLFASLPILETMDWADVPGPKVGPAKTASPRLRRKCAKELENGPMQVTSHLLVQEAVGQAEIQLVLAFLGDRIAEIMREQK